MKSVPDFGGHTVSCEEKGMTSKQKPASRRSRKTYWHLYSLQTLNPEKFIKVVDKILRQEFHLIK